MSQASALLEIRAVCKRFAGLTALRDISFQVVANEIKGLIGPNGAGKSTLFNVITSTFPADSGSVLFDGRNIAGMPQHKVARLGLGRTFQNVRLFGEQTVIENVCVGAYRHTSSGLAAGLLGLWRARAEERETRALARQCLEFVGLQMLADRRAETLPFGQQRLLEIARALAMKPRLVLLDEPAAGLNDVETAALAELILKLPRRGITVLLVEHNMDLMMRVADTIAVLNFGEKIADGPASDIAAQKSVIDAYLGEPEALP